MTGTEITPGNCPRCGQSVWVVPLGRHTYMTDVRPLGSDLTGLPKIHACPPDPESEPKFLAHPWLWLRRWWSDLYDDWGPPNQGHAPGCDCDYCAIQRPIQ